jgi:cysteine desulfurase
MLMIYLDHAATTPMRPGVMAAMEPFLVGEFGNPSGVHEVSRRAKNALEEARERVATLIGARPMEIVFTSGGTESDNLALKGAVHNSTARSGLVTIATEHDAVLQTAYFLRRRGHEVNLVGVDHSGMVSPKALIAGITEQTAVVSVMTVNSETGVLADIANLAAAVKERYPQVLFHTDAVQAFNSEVVATGPVDMISLAGHKLGGPKGVGMLYVGEGVHLEPVLHGGGHELGRRSGTQNVAGAVGMATAMEAAAADREGFRMVVSGIRDDFEKRALAGIDGAMVNGGDAFRTPQHLNLRIPGVRNQVLLMRLDQAGVAASAGSACQSGAAKVSHVLESMGLTPDQARETVRFSFGWDSTHDDGSTAAEILVDLVGELR